MKRFIFWGPDVVEQSTLIPLRQEIDAKNATIKDRDGRILQLLAENAALKLRKQTVRSVIDVELGDPTPTITEERKTYVASVAGFYRSYLKNKLNALLGDVRMQLEKMDGTRDENGNKIHDYTPSQFDLILKGTANALWLLHDWGQLMENEHQAYTNPQLNGEERELTNELAS